MIRISIIPILFLLFSSCANDEKWKDPDAVFFDYKIRGEERDSNITVYIQYRMGGPNGTTLVLNDPAKVQLDGEIIPVDSARLTGVFYEIQRPAHSFAGEHTITFTNPEGKQYNEEFDYQPFSLKTNIPAIVYRGDLVFDFEGLKPGDHIRVVATDTSFLSKDINEIDTVRNGRLIIPANKLKNLVDGAIILLLSRETDRSVKNGTKQDGRIVVSYGLQREFELKDVHIP